MRCVRVNLDDWARTERGAATMTSQVSRKHAKSFRRFVLILFAALIPCGVTSTTLAVEQSDAVTPLVAMPLAEPNPALGADDKIHLAYEFALMNMAPGMVKSRRSRLSMPQVTR